MAAAPTTYTHLLYDLLETAPAVIFRRGSTAHGELGIVQHANNIVTINRSAAPPDFASALIRATIDLHRGSNRAPDPVREAAKVREIAARIAVHPALSLLDFSVEPAQLAAALGVDLETALLGIQLAAAEGGGPTMG
jgi:hypothetical protein